MSSINTSSSGYSYLTGSISGLDTESLIEAAVNAKLTKANRLDDTVDTNTTKISAYQQLQTYTNTLIDALSTLKSGSNNAFDKKSATLLASSGDAENILEATATSTALTGTHRIVVQQLAQSQSVTGSAQSSSDTALGYTGSFTLSSATGSATISITSDMSLSDIVDTINTSQTSSGVTADLMQTGSGYSLVLNGLHTAESFTATHNSGDSILASLGILDSNGDLVAASQEAQSAIITLDGTTITSADNYLENILNGVTLTLNNAAPSTSITLIIGQDSSTLSSTLQDAVDAYNTLRNYLDQMQAISNGAAASTAYLYGESIVRSFSHSLSSIVTSAHGTGAYNSLGSIGITFDEDNQLSLDTSILDDALTDNLSAVRNLFISDSTHDGLGDLLSDLLDGYSNSATGVIAAQVSALETTNTTLTAQSDKIKDYADSYEALLVNKYAAMEVKLQTANLLKAQIEAILTGSTSNDG